MAEEQDKGGVRPTLFIGLGGSGKEILFRLRRKFYERWRQTSLPCTAFLWIDTDSRDVLAQGEKIDEIDLELKFAEHEKVALLQGTVGQDLGAILRGKERYRYIHDWLHTEVEQYGVEIGSGAGAVRSVGRLTLFPKLTEVRDRIERALNRVTSLPQVAETREKYLPEVQFNPAPQAYLIFSVAGGTGGGTFLDIAFLLRQMGFQEVTGIMLLPNVYYETAYDETAARSYGNAYSALKELEFFTRRIKPPEVHGDQTPFSVDFEVNWTGQREKPIQGPPFSVLYLCEMRNGEQSSQGISVGNRTELFHMVADSIFMNFLPGPFSQQMRSRLSDISAYMAGVQDDEVPVAGTSLRQSYSRRYSALGMSKIEVPVESVREACACRLSKEILEHWDRQAENLDLKGEFQRALQGRFDADALEGLFGDNWKKTIEQATAKEFPELPADTDGSNALEDFVNLLPAKLQGYEKQLVSSVGYTQAEWGQITSMLRNSTGRAGEQLRKKLRDWISGSLERQDLGVNALLGESGLISHLLNWFRQFSQDIPSESQRRGEQAGLEATAYRERRDRAAAEMAAASRSFLIKLLGLKRWTLEILYAQVRENAEQQVKAAASAILAEEAGKAAKVGQEYLTEQRLQLQNFKEFMKPLHGRLEELERNFSTMGRTYLSIRIFDPKEDFAKFYLLDFDNNLGRHLPVQPNVEHRRYLDKTVGADKTTLDLMEMVAREGRDWLRTSLRSYAAHRFAEDFATCRQEKERHRECGRFVEVLNHPQMRQGTRDKYSGLVASAMPMLRRTVGFAGGTAKQVKKVFLAVPSTDREPYLSFQKQVTELLSAKDYPAPALVVTDDPSAVALFVETYAFPLPAVDLVVNECHNAYYSFYEGQQTVVKQLRHKIPLHLCSNWEGEFDDLRPIEETVAKASYDALQILVLGSVLGVIGILPKDHRREYMYMKWIAPGGETRDLGNKRVAIEILQKDQSLRAQLLTQISIRENRLRKSASPGTDALKYFWALAYLRYALFPFGPENNIIVERSTDLHNYLESLRVPLADLTGMSRDKQIAHCKEMLRDVKWVGDFPVLYDLLILGREEQLAASL